jgi:hypothetical protein
MISLAFLPFDGPITCIWKAMHGKGWMTGKEIIEAVQTSHYSPLTLYRMLGKADPALIEQRRSTRRESRGGAREYRVVPGSAPPIENRRATKQQMEVRTAMKPVRDVAVKRRRSPGSGEVQRVVWTKHA